MSTLPAVFLPLLVAVMTGGTGTPPEIRVGDLVGPEWIAELVAGQPIVEGTRIAMTFETDGRVHGSGGCNRFQGGYTIEEGRLSFGPLASTMRACPEPILDQERSFHRALEEAVTIGIEEGKLVFRGEAENDVTRLAPATLARIDGTVLYRERLALPENATVTVRLVDVSRADAPAVLLAETTIPTEGRQVPIPFELSYDPSRIDPRMLYALEAEIRVDGERWFLNDTVHPVITRDAPTDGVEIRVVRVGGE